MLSLVWSLRMFDVASLFLRLYLQKTIMQMNNKQLVTKKSQRPTKDHIQDVVRENLECERNVCR